ncbi:hypothetical protein [Brachyspira pulli]|uniref:hypothetical protein n=1 Tax=Brachyspira pulli TaxID=310721 RepID=UPI003004B17E
MKNKVLLNKISILIYIVVFTILLTLIVLGNISRKSYLSEFKLNESLSSQGNYSYNFRVKYYSKIFRNSDIYGVYLDTNKIIQDNNFIKEIKFDEKGSPFGILTSTKELKYNEEIDNIYYKLKIKLSVLLFILSILFIYIFATIIYKYKNKKILFVEFIRKTKHFCVNHKKHIFISYSTIVILFILFVIINSSIKHKSQLTDLELIAESKAGYVYKAKIENYKDNKLFSINNNSIKINNTNDIKYYGYSLEITNKPLFSWHSTNIHYTENNTFIISNESDEENGYGYDIEIPTYVGDKYKITILAKQFPDSGNASWHLNTANGFKEIIDKTISNDYIVLTDTREITSAAAGFLTFHLILPKGVTEIESILIENLNSNLNIENGYTLLTTKNMQLNYTFNVVYDLNTKYKVVNIIIISVIIILLLIFYNYNKKYNSNVVNIIFILLYAFISFPLIKVGKDYIHGLDPSWIYYINFLSNNIFKFGRDVFFTYGHLGYLMNTLSINNNFTISFIFKISVYIINTLLLYLLIKEDNIKLHNMFMSIIIFLLYFSSYKVYGLFDYYISFTIVLLLLLDIKYNNNILYILACIFIIISFFIKLSSGILNFAILFTYFFSLFFYKEKKIFINRTIISLIIPILIFVLYIIYNPSVSDFFQYIKSALEISSGYIYSMSIPYSWNIPTIALILSYIFVLIYVFFVVFYFIKRDFNFVYLFVVAILFFLIYRHSFIRNHLIFIYPFSFVLSILLLVIKDRKLNYIFIISFIILSFLYKVDYSQLFKINKINHIKETFNAINLNNKIEYSGTILPENMLNEISTNEVTIYPWEISYIISNKLNFKPMPIFQAYSAYTPYLDKLNADFFDNKNSPEYIIFEWESIDFRLPLTDTPLTFQKIYDNYYVYNVYDAKYMLLKKRETKLNHTIKSNYTQNNIDIYKDTIYFDNITESNTYLILKSNIDLNLLGKLSKIIYQIPPIFANIETYGGKKYSFRILLPQLKNGIIISKLPISLYELNTFFSNSLEDSIKSISFSAEGLHLYKNKIDINVDIVEIK